MMQGTQKEYPIEVLVHKETTDKKTRNIISKNDASIMTEK